MNESVTRVIKLGLNNFWRNRFLTLGATLLMTLTLTMVTTSLIVTFLVRDGADLIRSKIDFSIFFRDDSVTDVKILDLSTAIKANPQVKDVILIDKAKALELFNRLQIDQSIKDPLSQDNNPLPRSLSVKISSPEAIESIVASLPTLDEDKIICSDCVSYNKNRGNLERVTSVTRLFQKAGLGLSIFFGVIAIFNVLNIIRMTIEARSDEIEIMRYVGASNWFIRGPFVVEGITHGLLATLFTTVFLLIFIPIASPYVNDAFRLFGINLWDYVLSHLSFLVLVQLIIGVVIGVAVSLFSVRKYLHV